MRSLPVTFLMLFAIGGGAAEVADGVDVPKLAIFDDVMSGFMKAHNFPDAQLAIDRNEKLVFARTCTHLG